MTILNKLNTEKGYTLANNSVVALVLEKNAKLNKIQLTKAIQSLGLTPLVITKVNLPAKIKKRGKFWNKVKVKRASKFYIRLANGQQMSDENLTKLNEILIK